MSQPSVFQIISSTDRRGAETFAVELDRELTERGHDVTTCALQPGASESRIRVPILGPSPFSPSTLRAVRSVARTRDVVIAHGSVTLPAAAIALAGSGARIVYRNIGDPLYWSSSAVKRLRTRMLLSLAHHVVALAPQSATTLHERFSVPRDRITVIPNGADATRFSPADPTMRTSARRRLGVPLDSTVAVWIGNLSEEKNPRLAFDVAARVPEVSLLMVGDGPLRAELQSIAGAKTRFLGRLTDPLPALHAADVLLLTSDTEGLPAVVVEAGLCALPVVATDVGFVASVVEDGRTGFVVARGDAGRLAEALTDALDRREDLGSAARQRCTERYALDRIADDWSAVLEAVVCR